MGGISQDEVLQHSRGIAWFLLSSLLGHLAWIFIFSLLQFAGSLGSAACEVVPDTRKGDFPLRRAPHATCVSSSGCSCFPVPFQSVTSWCLMAAAEKASWH